MKIKQFGFEVRSFKNNNLIMFWHHVQMKSKTSIQTFFKQNKSRNVIGT